MLVLVSVTALALLACGDDAASSVDAQEGQPPQAEQAIPQDDAVAAGQPADPADDAPAGADESGIEDQVIAAVLAGDADALAALSGYQDVACVSPNLEGLGGPPDCAPGETEGTIVQAFPVAYCEGTWERDVRQVMEWYTDLPHEFYAVVQAPDEPRAEPYWPVGDTYLVFETEMAGHPVGTRLVLEDGKIVLAFFGCGHTPSDLVQHRGQPLPGAPLPTEPDAVATLPDLPYYLGSDEVRDPFRLPFAVDSFGALFMHWNAHRSALAYVQGGDLWVWQNGATINVTNTSELLEGLPRWSPDGRWIAFASRPFLPDESPEALQGTQGGLALISLQAGEEAGYMLLSDAPLAWPPSWGPKSDVIAFAADGAVHLVNLAGEPVGGFTAAELGLGDVLTGVEWSPVRTELLLAFGGAKDGPPAEGSAATMGYAVVQGDGSGTTMVQQWESAYVPPPPARWSPDGDEILIAIPPVSASLAPDYPASIWVAARPDRGLPAPAPRQVTAVRTPYQAVWSPNGARIAVIENGERRVLILDAATLEVVAEPPPGGGVEGLAW